jgi:hypothetical protein
VVNLIFLMLVQPTLPDHPKFLLLKQQLGPCAMEVLVRMWGYAQTIKTADLGRVDAAYVKTITRYGGSKDKLWGALAIPQLRGKAGWLDVADDGTVHVHGFDEYNRNLKSCRDNGKAGGRPTGQPKRNPPDNPPDNPPPANEVNGMNRTELNEAVRSVLGGLYGRKKDDTWSHFEESTLFELQKRAGFSAEVTATVDYRRSLPQDQEKFFPHTLARLLDRWTEIQDVVVAGRQKKGAPTNTGTARERGELLQELALARADGDAAHVKELQDELHPK